MRYGLLATAGLAALAIAGALPSALGYVRSGPGVMPHGHHRLATPGGSVAPPLDSLPAASGAYSFRKLRTAYAGPAVKLQRVDTTMQDIGFTASGDFDAAAATAFCTTACAVQTRYNQGVAGQNLTQATAANQPPYVASCQAGRPCMQTTAATQTLATAGNTTPATGLVSISVVANRSVGIGLCLWLREDGAASNRLTASNVANTWIVGPPGTLSAPATDAVWHAAVGVLSPTAGQSLINIDGAEVTGTQSPIVTAGVTAVAGAASTTCQHGEEIFWDNDTRSPAERAALVANQRAYWGF